MPKRKSRTPVKYTSRDFKTIKNDLIEHAKRYYPDSYKDFSEAGFGSFMIDIVSYIGDNLSFYLDYEVNESMAETSIEYNNIIKHGRSSGYKFKAAPSSYGNATFYILVPANTIGIGPNYTYAPRMLKGSEFSTVFGNSFILNEDILFSDTSNEVVVAQVNENTGVPTYFAIKAIGKVISGRIVEDIKTVGEFEKFKRIRIGNSKIAEILSIRDGEGHEYFEVDNLSQNTIFKEIINLSSDRNTVPFILKPFIALRRYTVEQERDSTYIQFGHGTNPNLTEDQLIEPSNVTLNLFGKKYVSDTSFDPSKLLKSDKFGIAPANTKLRIIYRENTSDNVNSPVESLTEVVSPVFRFEEESATNSAIKRSVVTSLQITNEEPINGDVSLPSAQELKQRIRGHFSTQNRAVTKQDYVSMIYSMPPQFGAIKRANIVRDNDSFKRNLSLYIISEDNDGSLINANDSLKNNLKIWLNNSKMINDTIDILDAKIVNIGINFKIIADRNSNQYDVLSKCYVELNEYLSVLHDIGEPFSITDIFKRLNSVDGVADTISVEIKKKIGASYSDNRFNINKNISLDGRYLEVPENMILEVKFPKLDIKGSLS